MKQSPLQRLRPRIITAIAWCLAQWQTRRPRIPPPPPLARKHIEERYKFTAGGLQSLALLLFGAILLQPLINVSLAPPPCLRVAAVFVAGLAELFAFILLRYIPFTPDPKDRTP